MTLKIGYAVIGLLSVIILLLVGDLVGDYIEYVQMLEFERELDESIRRTKAIYGGN